VSFDSVAIASKGLNMEMENGVALEIE